MYYIGSWGSEGSERSGGKFSGKTSFKLCVFFVVLLCVCDVLGRGGRPGRSAEEDESTLVSSFSKTQYRSVSGERQPDSARLGSSRLGSSRLISKISQIKKWMVVQRQRMGASLSV